MALAKKAILNQEISKFLLWFRNTFQKMVIGNAFEDEAFTDSQPSVDQLISFILWLIVNLCWWKPNSLYEL